MIKEPSVLTEHYSEINGDSKESRYAKSELKEQ